MIAGAALYIPFAELVDIQAEIERLEKKRSDLPVKLPVAKAC